MSKTYTNIDAVHTSKRKVVAVLVDDAKNQSCIRCDKPGETRRCHYNGWRAHRFGKGRSKKPHDTMVAEFCRNCDELFSEQNYDVWEGGSKSIDRSEEFLFWIAMTIIRRAKLHGK